MERQLKAFISANRPRLGFVSMDAPLISNLSIWSNMALIRQYHQNTPLIEARDLALDLLGRVEMGSIAEKRGSSLTTEERFLAMLLRAVMVRDPILVLDRPFGILTNLRDGTFIMDALQKIDDLIAEAHIFDYSWMESCYGGNNGAED